MSAAVFSQPQLNELSVSGIRDGREVVVSAWLHNPSDGPAFEIVDLLSETLAQRDLLTPVRHALAEMPAGVETALWGISLPCPPGQLPAGFTVSVTLGQELASEVCADGLDARDVPAWDGAEVIEFTLDGYAGFRRSQLTAGPAVSGVAVQLLTVTYVAHTPHGILAIAFGTAHLDAGDVFMALFDRIAGSVRIVSGAPSTVS